MRKVHLPFLLLVSHIQSIESFVSNWQCHPTLQWRNPSSVPSFPQHKTAQRKTVLAMAVSEQPNWDSTNPWGILGISSSSSKQEIKKAYKRLAMQYHPDVSASSDKKMASDRFAKINWAYRTALEQQQSGRTTTTSTTDTKSTWEPPHRRKAGSSRPSSSYTTPTDWRDYMPNYGNDSTDYSTDGDSFGKIFSDLFRDAATGRGSTGLFSDFVEFFESNFDYSSSSSTMDDPELTVLLQTGTVEQVGEEMDETELVIQQLNTKIRNSQDEAYQLQAEIASISGYTAKMRLQERMDEIEAQKKVVEGYIAKANKRLLALQTRYKDLIVNGKQDDRKARSQWEDIQNEASSRKNTASASSSEKESWKSEGFGASGRGRGSSRRRRRQTENTNPTSRQETTSSSYARPPRPSPRPPPASYSTPPQRTPAPASYSSTPPHRRPDGRSSYAQKLDNERRLREIKVDEEFDKLKEELGL